MPFIADRALGLPPLTIRTEMGFRSIDNGIGYAMCKSLHCATCGHLFVDYRFNEVEMTRLYSGYRGREYSLLRNKYEPGYLSQNETLVNGNNYKHVVENFLSDLLPFTNLTILDWGGDTGRNTPFGSKASVVHIYDPSSKPVELENAVNILSSNHFLDSYQLVVLANVLEHIPFPADMLSDLKRYMVSSSILYVEVPYETIQVNALNEPPYSLGAMKYHWHEHINFFSKSSLLEVLHASGLEIVKIAAIEVDCESTGVSFTNILQAVCRLSEKS